MLRTKSPSAKPPVAYMQTLQNLKSKKPNLLLISGIVGKGGLACATITAEEEVVKIT